MSWSRHARQGVVKPGRGMFSNDMTGGSGIRDICTGSISNPGFIWGFGIGIAWVWGSCE